MLRLIAMLVTVKLFPDFASYVEGFFVSFFFTASGSVPLRCSVASDL